MIEASDAPLARSTSTTTVADVIPRTVSVLTRLELYWAMTVVRSLIGGSDLLPLASANAAPGGLSGTEFAPSRDIVLTLYHQRTGLSAFFSLAASIAEMR